LNLIAQLQLQGSDTPEWDCTKSMTLKGYFKCSRLNEHSQQLVLVLHSSLKLAFGLSSTSLHKPDLIQDHIAFDPGKAGDSTLKITPESDRVKQCLLAQILATQAVGMFYGVAVIVGNTIFKGNSGSLNG
jgi:hypothetical protein